MLKYKKFWGINSSDVEFNDLKKRKIWKNNKDKYCISLNYM